MKVLLLALALAAALPGQVVSTKAKRWISSTSAPDSARCAADADTDQVWVHRQASTTTDYRCRKTGASSFAWTDIASAPASGEANTASNQGAGGVGPVNGKVGVDLQFRNINAGSSKVTVTLDSGNKEIDIDVDQSALNLASIPGTAALATSVAGGSSGQVPYQSGAGVTAFSSAFSFSTANNGFLGLIGGYTAGQSSTATGKYVINGLTSGSLTLTAPDVAGTNSQIKFPAGIVDFSATGGTSQVVKQTSAGGAFTVARLACSDLSNASASCSTDTTVATNITSGTLPAARLPNPSASTLGGVQSKTCSGTDKFSAIGTDGVPVCSTDQNTGTGSGTTLGLAVTKTSGSVVNMATGSRRVNGTVYQLANACDITWTAGATGTVHFYQKQADGSFNFARTSGLSVTATGDCTNDGVQATPPSGSLYLGYCNVALGAYTTCVTYHDALGWDPPSVSTGLSLSGTTVSVDSAVVPLLSANNAFTSYQVLSEIATPSNPASGLVRIYAKSGSGLCALDNGGTERCTGTGGGGGDMLLGTAQTSTAKKTFSPTGTAAGLMLTCAALPSSPANGDIACDSGDSNQVKVRSNGSWITVGSGGSMTYPGAGIANSTGSAWGTSYTTSGTGTVLALAAGPTITGHATIEGVTATGATGTGKFVFDGTPTLVTPNISAATGTSLALSGAIATGGATNSCDGTAGCLQLTQGTAPSGQATTGIQFIAPTSVTSYRVVMPGSSTTGFLKGTNSSNVNTWSFVTPASSDLSDASALVKNNAANTWSTGLQDFAAAGLKIPSSTTLPGTCAVGQIYMDTDATSGQRLYLCESTNTWALQGDGTGSGSFGETSLAGLVNSQTLWDGANATRTLTFAVTGTDPVMTFTASTINVTTGALQVGGSAVLVSGGALGTPSSGTGTNLTGIPISTGISGLGTGVATALATMSSANLRSAVTDESGTGVLLFAGGDIGAATGTSLALTGALSAASISTGTSPPTAASGGTGGAEVWGEGTAPSANCVTTGVQCMYADSSTHSIMLSGNGRTAASIVTAASSTTATQALFATSTAHAPAYRAIAATDLPAALSSQTSINGLTITASTGTLTVTNAKTASFSNSITLAGTDSTTMTFPTTSATIARTDSAQTFTGTQTFGAVVGTTWNGNTWATGTGTLSIAAGKTFTSSNTLTLAGTDSTTLTFQGTDTYVGRATTDTLTNKTIDAEGTGNTITIVDKFSLMAAGGTAAAPYLLWNTLATNAPTPTCAAGVTETTLLDCYATFPDSDGDYSLQVPFFLPSDWTGNIDLKLKWKAAATSGDVVWQATMVCRADAEINDAAFNSANTVTDTAKGTTLQLNDASITSMTTTGCSAGELATLKVFRNRTNGSDTITGTVLLEGVEVTLRRAQ